MTVDSDLGNELRLSYVLAFGELGEYSTYSWIQFVIFFIFSFFIPLMLLNMLIAIMSDVYERVQSNVTSADARSLAEMILEMEELVYLFKSIFSPNSVKPSYFYCFYVIPASQDSDNNNEWTGMVGELKNTITNQVQSIKNYMNQD